MIFDFEKEIKGPPSSFSPTHILKAILLLDGKCMGRKALAAELQIGEGAARTMLSKMKSLGIIKCERRGCSLTKEGIELYRRLSSHISISYDLNIPYAKPFNCAVAIRGGGKFVKKGLEERDVAILGGAKGASIFVLREGCLWMPELENISEKYPDEANEILSKFELGDGDVIILAWADDRLSAEHGALNATLYLIKKMEVI